MTRLGELRTEIDRIDAEMLALLHKRAQLAMRVGEVKRAGGLPVYDPSREAEILARASTETAALNGSGALDAAAVRRIFRRIIRETRNAELRASASGVCSHLVTN